MQAFHADPAVKAKYVARLRAHRAAEELVQGQGFKNGKGCAVGCTLDNYDHARYPTELGLPVWIAHLENQIFEGLPKAEAEKFAEDFLAVIPVGADVDAVRWQLAILRHTQDLNRLSENTEPYAAQCRQAIQGVIAWITAGSAAESAWSAARSAWSAESAAWSARSAAWSAWSARSVVWSVAARSKHYAWEAKTLLELLSDSKVPA